MDITPQRLMRIYFIFSAALILVNFAVFNDLYIWYIVNTVFVITPFLYFLMCRMKCDKVVLAILILLAVGTIYQHIAGYAETLDFNLMWVIIDTTAVMLYSFLAGAPHVRIEQ